MEAHLYELQNEFFYSYEVAKACVKLELESNEREEAHILGELKGETR